jgi:SAM-dependent methyltransferase
VTEGAIRQTTQHFARRTASKDFAFMLPYLRSGMALLDCGCGPGTISADLAEIVAPGEFVGIDRDDDHLQRARALAAERGLTNARFEHADVHHLPFPDNSFDAAIASRLLEHLPDPVAPMREVHRVVKPGGVVGVCSPDYGGTLIAPESALLDEWIALHKRVRERGGGNPHMGRHLPATLVTAGFVRVVGSCSMECPAGAEEIQRWGEGLAQFALGQRGQELLEFGWADQPKLEQLADALRAWGRRPGAFYATPHCEAIGWVD